MTDNRQTPTSGDDDSAGRGGGDSDHEDDFTSIITAFSAIGGFDDAGDTEPGGNGAGAARTDDTIMSDASNIDGRTDGAASPDATTGASTQGVSIFTPVVDADDTLKLLPERLVLDGPVPSPRQPSAVARYLLMLLAEYGVHVRHWRDTWHVWRQGRTGGRYQPLTGSDNRYALSDCVRATLEAAVYLHRTQNSVEERAWAPTTTTVREVTDAMAAQMRLSDDHEAGTWLRASASQLTDTDTGTVATIPGHEVTCVADGLLWCPRGAGAAGRRLLDHTPEFFTDAAVAVAYDPDAGCERWTRFLDELWPGDEDSKALLQEWFGYVLAGSTGLHKMLALIGPRRSGKGTIAWVLEQLLGGRAHVDHPAMARLAEPFGLAPMLGKRLAVIGDARLGRSDAAIVEKLLMISGEDPVTVNRKNRDELSVKLDARIMILSNDMPDLRDTTGALASRFLPLRIRIEGFLGREDFGLKATLAAELSGILAWALDGADRLWERGGRFTVGEAVAASMVDVERQSSPVKAFALDCLVLESRGPEWAMTPKDEVYEVYAAWCVAEGYRAKGKNIFFRDLVAAYPGQLEVGRVRVDGERVQVLHGARLGSEF